MTVRGLGPGADRASARPLVAVLLAASAALAFAWRFLPLSAGLVVALYVAVVGLAVGGVLVRTLWRHYLAGGSVFEAVVGVEASEVAARPAELVAIERAVATGTVSALEAHLRLRPLLRAVLVPGLTATEEEHGPARREREAARDAALSVRAGALGPALWELVRPGRPRPGHFDEPGCDLEVLEAIVEELEGCREEQ